MDADGTRQESRINRKLPSFGWSNYDRGHQQSPVLDSLWGTVWTSEIRLAAVRRQTRRCAWNNAMRQLDAARRCIRRRRSLLASCTKLLTQLYRQIQLTVISFSKPSQSSATSQTSSSSTSSSTSQAASISHTSTTSRGTSISPLSSAKSSSLLASPLSTTSQSSSTSQRATIK